MSHFNTILYQLLQVVPRYQFESLVSSYKTDRYTKYYTTWRQFITLIYAQIKGKDSLRDIITSLSAYQSSWYHVGIEDVPRSTISDAYIRTNYRVYKGLFYACPSH